METDSALLHHCTAPHRLSLHITCCTRNDSDTWSQPGVFSHLAGLVKDHVNRVAIRQRVQLPTRIVDGAKHQRRRSTCTQRASRLRQHNRSRPRTFRGHPRHRLQHARAHSRQFGQLRRQRECTRRVDDAQQRIAHDRRIAATPSVAADAVSNACERHRSEQLQERDNRVRATQQRRDRAKARQQCHKNTAAVRQREQDNRVKETQ